MGGGNRFFSDHPEFNCEVIQEAHDWDSEAQLRILHDLKSAIEAHEPSFRHQQNSSFDSGKANGLKIACMYIDIKIKELL